MQELFVYERISIERAAEYGSDHSPVGGTGGLSYLSEPSPPWPELVRRQVHDEFPTTGCSLEHDRR